MADIIRRKIGRTELHIVDFGTGDGNFVDQFGRVLAMRGFTPHIVGIESNEALAARAIQRHIPVERMDIAKAVEMFGPASQDIVVINAPQPLTLSLQQAGMLIVRRGMIIVRLYRSQSHRTRLVYDDAQEIWVRRFFFNKKRADGAEFKSELLDYHPRGLPFPGRKRDYHYPIIITSSSPVSVVFNTKKIKEPYEDIIENSAASSPSAKPRRTAAGSPLRQQTDAVKETGRLVNLLQEMPKDKKRQQGPFGEMVSLVISLSAFTAFGGFFGAVFAGVLKNGVWMSLALTVAILGAGAWVAAVIARAVVHAVHGVIAYFKGFHDGAEKDAVVSKDNPAFVRLGTLLKLTVLSLALAAIPLVPGAISLAGGLLTGLGMFLGKDILKTVPVFLAAVRNRRDLADAAARAKVAFNQRYTEAAVLAADKTFAPGLVLIAVVYTGLGAVFGAAYFITAAKAKVFRGARFLLRQTESGEGKKEHAFEAGIFNPFAGRAPDKSDSKSVEKGKSGASSPLDFPDVTSGSLGTSSRRNTADSPVVLKLSAMQGKRYDVAILGGGINAAQTALALASRGVSVALVEKSDYASGASGGNTTIAHGGLRYLEQAVLHLIRGVFLLRLSELRQALAHLRLLKEALREREILFRDHPDFVRPEEFYYAVYQGDRRRLLWVRMGVRLYDFLAGIRKGSPRRHRVIRGDAAKEKIEELD